MRLNEGRVRRFFSILLLMLFAMPLLTPLLALSGGALQDSQLLACCRRDGAHHCAMPMAAQPQRATRERQWDHPVESCPFGGAVLLPGTGSLFRPTVPVTVLFSAVLAHPSGVAQTQSRLRIARGRSRLKRGPPALPFVESIS